VPAQGCIHHCAKPQRRAAAASVPFAFALERNRHNP